MVFAMMISPPSLPPADAPGESAKGAIRQANEALIVAAAERVFAGAGFAGATMAAIAEAAGLPKANLHYYFGSKPHARATGHVVSLVLWGCGLP